MKIKTTAQAKKVLQDSLKKMHAAYTKGIKEIAKIMSQGRKIIEATTQRATQKSADRLLRDL